MKGRMTQIAEGRINVLLPEVAFSEEKLKCVVLPDRTTSLEFTVSSENHVPMRLFFRSTNPRVSVSNEVSVREFGKISLEIDSKGLSLSDEIRGTIDVLYNGGERSIPYVFTVGAKNVTKPQTFRSLEEFAAFAGTREEEATLLFSLKEFLLLPFMKDLHLQGLYRTFANDKDPRSGMIEFLNAAGFERKAGPEEEETVSCLKKREKPESSSSSREKRMQYRLLSAFLQYEAALHTEDGVAEASERISRLSAVYSDSPLASLLLVYDCLQDQRMQQAKEILLKIQDVIQKNRTEEKAEYCLFLYLASIVQQDKDRIESAGKLIRKYYEETPTSLFLSMLEYRVNADPDKEPEKAAEFLRQCWFRGLKYTPVLESTALLYRETGVEPDSLTEYELMSILYGIRKGLINEQKLFRVLSRRELDHPKLLNIYLTVLKTGYQLFGNREFLLAVINVLLQKKYTGKKYFYWYSEAVRQNLTVQGLYEGYMLSLPDSFQGPLPENLVTYFGYHKESSGIDLAFLYSNVLEEYADRQDVQELYRAKISEFAIRSMKEEQYSLSMRPVYRMILRKEYLNEETAAPMFRLFSLHEVTTSIKDAKRIVLYYPELDEEDLYAFDSLGRAMVPIFSEEAIPAVENRKGERFHDESLRMERCYNDVELEKQCLLYTGGSVFMKLKEMNEIVKTGVLHENELFMATEIIKDRRIAPFYKTRLYESVIDLAETPSMEHVDCTDFLAEADYASFTQDYRLKLIGIFLKENRDVLAVERVMTYGLEGLSDEALLKITETAMTLPYLDGTDALLSCCYRLFSHDSASTRVIEYLSKHFFGPVSEMLSILKAVRRKKAAAYDLAERTLALGFFTGETKDLDSAFEFYLSEGGRFDVTEKAFLVLRSHEYLTERKRLSDTVVRELKKYVFSLPDAALIALVEHFAFQAQSLDKEDKKLLGAILLKCVEKNIVLSCFSEFEKIGALPFELENRVFVEQRRPGVREISIIGKTFPNQKVFHREMNEIYPGIFVQSFFLFSREWIEYSFIMINRDETVTEAEGGVLSREEGPLNHGGRYDDLMMLEKKIRENDMKATSDYLKKMLVKEAMIEDIFGK